MCHSIAEVCILKKFKKIEAMWIPEIILEDKHKNRNVPQVPKEKWRIFLIKYEDNKSPSVYKLSQI